MEAEKYNVIFFGRSGSGKDTQAQLLKKKLEDIDGEESVLYIHGGKAFRDLVEQQGFLTARFLKERIIDSGGKSPDFLSIWTWGRDFIGKLAASHHVILSGSPETTLEAKAMDDAFSFYDRKKIYPIYLNVDPAEAARRLKARGEPDDTEEKINQRLGYFDRWIEPTLEYYRKESQNKLITINANSNDKEKIHKEILKTLYIK